MFNRVVEATFDENFVVSVTAVSRYVIQKSPWDFTLNKSDIISVPENEPGTKKDASLIIYYCRVVFRFSTAISRRDAIHKPNSRITQATLYATLRLLRVFRSE